MQLPDNSIGISDIVAWRECPRRMSFSMKRHTEEGEPPEAAIEHAYGSMLHDALHAIEERDITDDVAIQLSFDKWGWALTPDDLERLEKDIETYHERDVLGVRTLAVEGEFKVPLMEWEGETIYFRFRLDRLYQRLDNAAVFIHVDYKTSAWRKSEQEVHEDLQMWAYNWGIHEFFPECDFLLQTYDQLNFGAIPTRKSERQRAQMKEWLVRMVTAILKDERYREEDHLLTPKFNEWCPWCPIKMDCPVIPKLSDYARSRIDALGPDKGALAKVGVDGTPFETYAEKLPEVQRAGKLLGEYEKGVKEVLKKLPTSERERLGWKLSPRRGTKWTHDALREAHTLLGEDFYALVGITKTRIEELLKDDDRREELENLAITEVTGEQMRAIKQG